MLVALTRRLCALGVAAHSCVVLCLLLGGVDGWACWRSDVAIGELLVLVCLGWLFAKRWWCAVAIMARVGRGSWSSCLCCCSTIVGATSWGRTYFLTPHVVLCHGRFAITIELQ